jgi:hypothetical protein
MGIPEAEVVGVQPPLEVGVTVETVNRGASGIKALAIQPKNE